MSGYVPTDFSASVLSPPGSRWAQICLRGDVDLAAVTALAAVIDEVAAAAPATVYVDLADITFADSTLPNFCVLLRAAVSPAATLTVCRPAPMTRWILEETGMQQILTLRDDLPLLDVSRITSPPHRNQRLGHFGKHKGAGSSAS